MAVMGVAGSGRGVESLGATAAVGPHGSHLPGRPGSNVSGGRGGARYRTRSFVPANCRQCGRAFDAWTPVGPFKAHCSRRCRNRADYLAKGIERALAKSAARSCRAGCGQHAAPARSYCTDTCLPDRTRRGQRLRQGPAEIECRHCRSPFSASRLGQHFCSTRCSNRVRALRDHGDRSGRGAGRKFPRVRYTARQAIFQRDNWTCQLCGAPIDPVLAFPHPGFATIDHRDPAGAHDPSNWQTAHLACNVSKGRKVAIGADPKLVRAIA